MGIGKLAEISGVLDIGLKTRHNGGLLYPTLLAGTDLNEFFTGGTYVGVYKNNYTNVPYEGSGGNLAYFVLEVIGDKDTGLVKQRFSKGTGNTGVDDVITYERIWQAYTEEWGEWLCTSKFNGTLLWQCGGGRYYPGTNTYALSEAISKQKTGVVFVFSLFEDNAISDERFSYHFVPKMHTELHDGGEIIFKIGDVGGYNAKKHIFLYDTSFKGTTDNSLSKCIQRTFTQYGGGETYEIIDNDKWVLRYVIGV